jgi:hypothetical protein
MVNRKDGKENFVSDFMVETLCDEVHMSDICDEAYMW